MELMRFGLNYIPSKRWLHSWIDWDDIEIIEDLWAIKELGFDHIRAHLIWPYFQIGSYQMSRVAMKNLERFVLSCETVKIDFFLSLFTGWMSGFNFLPSWLQYGRENAKGMFTDKEAIKAQRFYIEQIASVVAVCPHFLGFDLGNELSALDSADKNATIADRDQWSRYMFACCEKNAPGKLHNNGVDHGPWFYNQSFSRRSLANDGAITPLHCWTAFTGAAEKYGIMGTGSIHLAPYMVELAKAYAENSDRLYWIQEFGSSPLWHQDSTTEEFMIQTLDAIVECQNIWGCTWWCSHDIDKNTFADFHPIEYELGIFDTQNHPKPYGRLMAEYIKRYRLNPVRPLKRPQAMVVDDAAFSTPGQGDGWGPGSRYMQWVENGVHPAIVCKGKENDRQYLASRGITTILKG